MEVVGVCMEEKDLIKDGYHGVGIKHRKTTTNGGNGLVFQTFNVQSQSDVDLKKR